MGLRQPSKIKTFFAQAKAGAEQQKEARDRLKAAQPGKPVQALGGSAAAGTQMVAGTTGAQQAATQQVQQAGQEVDTKTATNQLPGATATTGVVAATNVPFTTPQVNKSSQDWWKWTGQPAIDRNIANVTENIAQYTSDIPLLKSEIDKIDADLKTATAADQKALLDKKTDLENTLTTSLEKLDKEKLGQIAGPSAFETEMEQREKLLAEQGNNVGKLASIFGPRWDAKRYGGLASQIYGKDLEAIQETAQAGLKERELSKTRSDEAFKAYKDLIARRKTEVGDAAKTQQDKIRGLGIGAAGLISEGYTEADIRKLYGADFDKFFEVTDGKIIDKFSKTKNALTDKLKLSETNLETAKTEKQKLDAEKAEQVKSTLVKKDEYGTEIGGTLKSARDISNFNLQPANPVNPFRMASWVASATKIKKDFQNKVDLIENQFNNAKTADDYRKIEKLLQDAKNEYKNALKNANVKVTFQ